jgi:4-carboxymuconolactone decarboxylase
MSGDTSINTESIEASYRDLTGTVPASITERIRLNTLGDRESSMVAIEALRDQLIMHNPLDRKTSQLVHFGQLLALGEEAASLHAGAAKKAGATLVELLGVVELALITAGMPAYSRGIEIVGALFPSGHD